MLIQLQFTVFFVKYNRIIDEITQLKNRSKPQSKVSESVIATVLQNNLKFLSMMIKLPYPPTSLEENCTRNMMECHVNQTFLLDSCWAWPIGLSAATHLVLCTCWYMLTFTMYTGLSERILSKESKNLVFHLSYQNLAVLEERVNCNIPSSNVSRINCSQIYRFKT